MDKYIRIAAIIIKNKKILYLKGDGPELWTPGGKPEQGETDEECLRRELHEEINAELQSMKFFKTYEYDSYFHPGRMVEERVYFATIIGNLTSLAEIHELIWISKDEYRKYKIIPLNTPLILDLIKNKFL
jgi:8-oxo-dGTP diphosphatase